MLIRGTARVIAPGQGDHEQTAFYRPDAPIRVAQHGSAASDAHTRNFGAQSGGGLEDREPRRHLIRNAARDLVNRNVGPRLLTSALAVRPPHARGLGLDRISRAECLDNLGRKVRASCKSSLDSHRHAGGTTRGAQISNPVDSAWTYQIVAPGPRVPIYFRKTLYSACTRAALASFLTRRPESACAR